ncbi:MAG: AbrB/MazE/SpoVT family DNA-binding domain-containing protein [Deltaproteobacteria bacterium]|nr:AbrB/MazE/SpoVT family DNA-binding domain-containing protein [Deltaproteobacteria bacterium]
MRQTIIISNRGQLTLPADLRKRFGIKNGGALITADLSAPFPDRLHAG